MLAALGADERAQLLCAALLRAPKMAAVLHLGDHVRYVAAYLPPQRQLSGGAVRLLQGALALLYTVHLFSCAWMFVSAWLQPSHVGAPSWIAADQLCSSWAYT